MLSFKDLAARIIDRARGELERDLHARNFPEATPIPMTDWLAQLDARAAANLQATAPLQDFAYDDGESPDPDDPRDFDFEDFDRRR